ncbi:hypothetical protein KKG83_03645, partial [Candidatus Micrarchaeota archaeon]|nr:hypothetical protein [Candidatus Micrarchaeota archaeon]
MKHLKALLVILFLIFCFENVFSNYVQENHPNTTEFDVRFNEVSRTDAKSYLKEKLFEIKAEINSIENELSNESFNLETVNATQTELIQTKQFILEAETLLDENNIEDSGMKVYNALEVLDEITKTQEFEALNSQIQCNETLFVASSSASIEITGTFLNEKIWVNEVPAQFGVVIKNNSNETQEVQVNAQPKSWYIKIHSFFWFIFDITEHWYNLGEKQTQTIFLEPSEQKTVFFDINVTGYTGGNAGAQVFFAVNSLTDSSTDEERLANSLYSSLPPWPETNQLSPEISVQGVWSFNPARILFSHEIQAEFFNDSNNSLDLNAFAVPQKYEGVWFKLWGGWGWKFPETGSSSKRVISIEPESSTHFSLSPEFNSVNFVSGCGGWGITCKLYPPFPWGRTLIGFEGNPTYWSHNHSIRVDDGDGIPDENDNCIAVPNPKQIDSDFDGIGDECDNCVLVFNPNQEDADGDGTGNLCDSDFFTEPEILSVSRNPENPTYLDNVEIKTKVTGSIENVKLIYYINNQVDTLPMDLVEEYYIAVIPAQPLSTLVEYQVSINDENLFSELYWYYSVKEVKNVAVILTEYTNKDHNQDYNLNFYKETGEKSTEYYLKESGYAVLFTFDYFDNNGNWYDLEGIWEDYNVLKKKDDGTEMWVSNNGLITQKGIEATQDDLVEDYFTKIAINNHTLLDGGQQFGYGIVIKEGLKYHFWVHELGHALGLVDHYEQNNKKGFIFVWGIMGHGPHLKSKGGGLPFRLAPFSSPSKLKIGWLESELLPFNFNGNLILKPLTEKSYGEKVYEYETISTKTPLVFPDNSYNFVIEARKENDYNIYFYKHKDFNNWCDDEYVEKGVNLYSVATRVSENDGVAVGNKYELNLNQNTNDYGDPTLMNVGDTFIDAVNYVKFNYISENSVLFKPEIRIERPELELENSVGAVLYYGLLGWESIAPFYNEDFEVDVRDLDLHAYSFDGNHAGMNYETGEYENQITGAIASGDVGAAFGEWIFVPESAQASFTVNSYDMQAFLNENPDANIEELILDYNINLIRYGANPELIEDENGNPIITDRIDFAPISGIIAPGQEITSIITATINFDPDTIIKDDSEDKNRFVTVYIEFNDTNISVKDIEISSVKLNNIIPAINDESYGFVKNPEIKDRDNNGKPEFMIKFYRHPIKNLLETGEQTET